MKYYGNGVHSYKVINDDLMIGVTHCFEDVNNGLEIYGHGSIHGKNSLIKGYYRITEEKFNEHFNKVINQIKEINGGTK